MLPNILHKLIDKLRPKPADNIQRIYLTLDQVIADCTELASKIAKEADERLSPEINIAYIKNGGAFPGEVVAYILKEQGYKVNIFSPWYGRYGEGTEGGEIEVKKDLTQKQKKRLAESINTGGLTIFLDELIDKGHTMEYANEQAREYPKVEHTKFYENVCGAVLYRKPKFFERGPDNFLMHFVQFYVKDFKVPEFDREMWLVLPWETHPVFKNPHYIPELNELIYNSQIEKLRKYIAKKVQVPIKESR
jgi:hypoxanthine phosphoribosyltransferase